MRTRLLCFLTHNRLKPARRGPVGRREGATSRSTCDTPVERAEAGMSTVLHSASLFILAGLAEIGGGYLVWLWWRGGRPWAVGVAGALVLFLYGIIPTYQPAHFGRV